jgi:hypothetical protein
LDDILDHKTPVPDPQRCIMGGELVDFVEVEHFDRKRAGEIEADKLISLETRLQEVGILRISQFSRNIFNFCSYQG